MIRMVMGKLCGNRMLMSGFAFVAVMVVSACSSMPSSGPSASAISRTGAEQFDADVSTRAVVVDLTADISEKLKMQIEQTSFVDLDLHSGNADAIGQGDLIEVSIWEAPPAVLFGGALSQTGIGSSQVTRLPEQMVDQNGSINIPFVGQIKVGGLSPRQVEKTVVSRLSKMAHQPQVIVRQIRNNSSNVTVIREGSSVRMPLTAKGERVLDAIAAVGGVQSANKSSIQLTRGMQVRTLPLVKITQDARQNIQLRPNDVITAINQPLSFVVLGATGRNEEINFEGEGISLIQALGRIHGLNDNRADARGVFVFRYEDAEIANAWNKNGSARLNQKLPVVYRVNLRDPNTFFYAQNFVMRDKDILYVSNAPASELQKFLQIVFSITSPITGTMNTINDLSN